jgi:hypothetical protein
MDTIILIQITELELKSEDKKSVRNQKESMIIITTVRIYNLEM